MPSNKQVRAIILASSYDFGRDPLASHLPPALWQVGARSVLERLLEHLESQEVKQVTICSNIDYSSYNWPSCTTMCSSVQFLCESVPLGTAGCIREAADSRSDDLIIVFSANIISPPQIAPLISAYFKDQSDLTIFFNPASVDLPQGVTPGELAGIYVCMPKVLQYIPDKGYCDIKEGLVPEILRAGGNVRAAVLPYHAGNFRDWQGYMHAVADYLGRGPRLEADFGINSQIAVQSIWISADTTIDRSARIYGPVVIMSGAQISRDAIVFGPTVIGKNVKIGPGSVVTASILWDRSEIGPDCEIRQCVLEHQAYVPANTIMQDAAVTFKPKRVLAGLSSSVSGVCRSSVKALVGEFTKRKVRHGGPGWMLNRGPAAGGALFFGGLAVLIAFLWSYWPGLVDLWRIWQRSDEYSSGLLVPFLAIYIVWLRRRDISQCPIMPCLWGIPAFLAAQAFRLFGVFFLYSSAERLSIVLSVWALVLLLFGVRLFRKVFTVLLFLCLMLPWPNRVQAAVTLPLQHWSTVSAVFCLETLGYDVVREGNVIHIGHTSVAVAEACNGLRMVTAFFVISGLVVLLVRRAWWEKLVILASSLPIALLCNILRLVITAAFFTVLEGEQWEKVFHDFGGYAMMPLALAATVGELWLLTRLTTVPARDDSVIISRRRA
jgi:exosortase